MNSSPVVFVVCLLLVVPGLVVAQPLVHPDGSVDPVPGSLEPPVSSGVIIQQTTTTITFDDLGAGEVVATDRYAAQGVLIEIGPGSTAPGVTS